MSELEKETYSVEFLKSRLHSDVFEKIFWVKENISELLELPEDLKKVLVKKRITAFRYPENEWTKENKLWLTEKWIEQAKNIVEKIKKSYWILKNIKIYYNDDTKRMQDFANILWEWLDEKAKLIWKIRSLSSLDWWKFNKYTKLWTKKEIWKQSEFIVKIIEKSDEHQILLLHSTTFDSIRDDKFTEFWKSEINNRNPKHWENINFDIDFNWNIVRWDSDILEINMYNQDNICGFLEEEDKFKNIISDYRKQKIDYVQLQNSINYIFYKNPDLQEKYGFLYKKNIKRIIRKLSEFLEFWQNYLLENYSKPEKINKNEINIIIRILKRIFEESDENIENYILNNLDEVNGMIIIFNTLIINNEQK